MASHTYLVGDSNTPMTFTDDQIDQWEAFLDSPEVAVRSAVLPWQKEIIRERKKGQYADGGGGRATAARAPSPGRPTGALAMAQKTANILSWGFEATGASGNTNVYASDPFEIADLKFDSDDATARVTLIKFGSAVLYEAASGSGVRATQFNADGFLRNLFTGLTIDSSHPLIVAVTNASSGSPKTTLILYGRRTSPGCSI